jgi:hypothetical protein
VKHKLSFKTGTMPAGLLQGGVGGAANAEDEEDRKRIERIAVTLACFNVILTQV